MRQLKSFFMVITALGFSLSFAEGELDSVLVKLNRDSVLRNEPVFGSRGLYKLNMGHILRATHQSSNGQWVKVGDDQGKKAWVMKSELEVLQVVTRANESENSRIAVNNTIPADNDLDINASASDADFGEFDSNDEASLNIGDDELVNNSVESANRSIASLAGEEDNEFSDLSGDDLSSDDELLKVLDDDDSAEDF